MRWRASRSGLELSASSHDRLIRGGQVLVKFLVERLESGPPCSRDIQGHQSLKLSIQVKAGKLTRKHVSTKLRPINILARCVCSSSHTASPHRTRKHNIDLEYRIQATDPVDAPKHGKAERSTFKLNPESRWFICL